MIAIPYLKNDSVELKFTLRSIEKYALQEVVIIGDLPDWIDNITHIPFTDSRNDRMKERNIFEKLCLLEKDFYYFNDDFILLSEIDKEYHYSGMLSEKRKNTDVGNPYKATLQNTLDIFGDMKCHYRHGPMFIEVDKFQGVKEIDWSVDWGYCLKSIYAHLNGIEGINYPDLKIRQRKFRKELDSLIKGREYFSTSERSINGSMFTLLKELFPKKSCFEI